MTFARIHHATVLLFLLSGLTITALDAASRTMPVIKLPEPEKEIGIDLNHALSKRRSHRKYSSSLLTRRELSQLLWSAQGITHSSGLRTAPSAGALYPLELFVISHNVEDLVAGIYHYKNKSHSLELITKGDYRDKLTTAAHDQDVIEQAAATIAITAVYARTEIKYSSRARRYVHIEVGHAAQNIYLQAAALNLGTVMVGAFDDAKVKQTLGLDSNMAPLALMPVGHLP